MQAGMDRSRARGVGSVFDRTGRANGSMADSSRTVCRNDATARKPFSNKAWNVRCSGKRISQFGKVICWWTALLTYLRICFLESVVVILYFHRRIIDWTRLRWPATWCDVRWRDVRWCEMVWGEVMWGGVMLDEVMWGGVRLCEVRWCDVGWC